MSVRVDYAKQRQDGGWEWSIKGYQGGGVYVRLATNTEGKCLYLLDGNAFGLGEQILDETFFVLPAAPASLAIQLLETALVRLGWGPIVRERRVCHK